MCKNKLVIAAAGSGKTRRLVNEALKINDKPVLITTYTEANEREIRKKFLERRETVPSNIKIQTWFSFLLQHGVRPYQSYLFEPNINGMLLVNEKSGLKRAANPAQGRPYPIYYSENNDLKQYYFSKNMKIFSDKISKFVVKVNELSNNKVITRISRIYPHIFIDEVQDLAGYDLEIIKELFRSNSRILLVGDPRQVTYLTHHEKKHNKYIDGRIKEFLVQNIPKKISYEIDETSLNVSHRNNQKICAFSNKLFPQFMAVQPCNCSACRFPDIEHKGIYLVRAKDVTAYLKQYNPVQLRWSNSRAINANYDVMTFGESKGVTLERVLIYPTKPMLEWIKNNQTALKPEPKAKLYVGITRAKHSSAFVYDYTDNENIEGTEKYVP